MALSCHCRTSLAALCLAVPPPAFAAELLTPIRVTSSTAASDFFPAANLVDNSGFESAPTLANYASALHSSAGASTAWVTDSPGGSSSDFYATGSSGPALTFTLGGVYDLTSLVVWGYHFTSANNNEARTLTVEFSTDGGTTWPTSATLTHQRTAASSDTLEFGATVSADTVRLTVTDNHFATPGAVGGNRVGLGEVKFIGAPPPNPNPVIAVAPVIELGNLTPGSPPLTVPLLISNRGSQQVLQVTASTLDPPFRLGSSALSISPGTSRSFDLTFDPMGRPGCYVSTLHLTTNDPLRPDVAVQLLGALDCQFAPPTQPSLSPPEGTFVDPFEVTITTPDQGAVLIYTTDGSLPGPENGLPYTSPFPITTSTQIRAASLRAGMISKPQTKSYLRLTGGLETYTSPLPIAIIDNFGSGPVPNKGWTPAHQSGQDLRQVPWQPACLHLIDRDPVTGRASTTGKTDLTERIGIRVRGAFSSTWNPKPYNLETWDEFDHEKTTTPLDLPGESDWLLYYPHPQYDRTLIANTFTWALSRQTGRYGTRFRFVDLFLNHDGGDLTPAHRVGVYAFAEKIKRDDDRLDFEPLSKDGTTGGWLLGLNRMDPEPIEGFPAENGATSPQFFHTAGPDRIQETPPNSLGQGDDIPRQWNAFLNFENPNGYRINAAQRTAIEDWFTRFEDCLYDDQRWRDPGDGYRNYLNTRDFIDYFHLHNLAKQGDSLLLSVFPWVSSGDRKLHLGPLWDVNLGAYGNSPNTESFYRSDRLWYPRLFEDPDFRSEYADRWFELRRGPFSVTNLRNLVNAQAGEITFALAAAQGVPVNSWTAELNSMISYLSSRVSWLDIQFFQPPSFSHPGGVVSAQFSLTITNRTGRSGTIFFTVDGSDPIDGAASAYTGPIAFNATANVRARVRDDNGEWSALNEASYITGVPAGPGDLVLSEIMYHPTGDRGAEFLELLNINPTESLDLALVRFVAGVDFTLPVGTTLAPGQRILIVRDTGSFQAVHGSGHPIAGEFASSSALDNSGDRLVCNAADGTTILAFSYRDNHPWPESADGQGDSLVLLDPFSNPDPGNPANWRSSTKVGGAPNRDDLLTFVGDSHQDRDRDHLPALLEHALGTSDLVPDSLPSLFTWTHHLAAGTDFRVTRSLAAQNVVLDIDWSDDLKSWEPVTAPPTLEAHLTGGRARFVHSLSSQPSARYFRLRASVPQSP